MSENTALGILFIIMGALSCLTNRVQGRIASIYFPGWEPTKSGRYPIPIFCGVGGIVIGAGTIAVQIIR